MDGEMPIPSPIIASGRGRGPSPTECLGLRGGVLYRDTMQDGGSCDRCAMRGDDRKLENDGSHLLRIGFLMAGCDPSVGDEFPNSRFCHTIRGRKTCRRVGRVKCEM